MLIKVNKKTNKPDMRGYFSKSRFEKWCYKNMKKADFLLYKLNDDWAEKMDGSDELFIEGQNIYLFLATEGKGLVRYRIPFEAILWKKKI
jgi:hypothetical protein